MAPVCEAAAWADSAKRPDLKATIGLTRAKARAADMNSRASLTDSMYRMIERVSVADPK